MICIASRRNGLFFNRTNLFIIKSDCWKILFIIDHSWKNNNIKKIENSQVNSSQEILRSQLKNRNSLRNKRTTKIEDNRSNLTKNSLIQIKHKHLKIIHKWKSKRKLKEMNSYQLSKLCSKFLKNQEKIELLSFLRKLSHFWIRIFKRRLVAGSSSWCINGAIKKLRNKFIKVFFNIGKISFDPNMLFMLFQKFLAIMNSHV